MTAVPKLNLSDLNSWDLLKRYAAEVLQNNKNQVSPKTKILSFNGVKFDISNQLIDEDILAALVNLANERGIDEKIEKLTSLAYPLYKGESEGLMRMKAPFTELYMAHIGSRAKGQFGFIKSLSYTVNESGDWDAESMLPRLFDIAISYQILNRTTTDMNSSFYMSDQS